MLGFCYKDGDTYRLEVNKNVVEFIIKELEGYIEAMVKNKDFAEASKLMEDWKKLNKLIAEKEG